MLMIGLATGAIETDGGYGEVFGEVEGLKTLLFWVWSSNGRHVNVCCISRKHWAALGHVQIWAGGSRSRGWLAQTESNQMNIVSTRRN